MQLSTVTYDRASGWSATFPELDSDDTLVLVFGSTSFLDDPSPIDELCAAFPTAKVVGCSSAGEIHADRIADESLAVAVARMEQTKLRVACATVTDASGSRGAGESIARELDAPDLRGVLVLSDGLNINGTELVAGLNAVLSDDVVVTGGLAGDGDRFERTWVISERRPQAHRVCAVGFYGHAVQIAHGSKGGWDIFGPERVVTRAEGNVLYELDNSPALELYKRYLGDRADGLPATGLLFPLAIRSGPDDEKQLVRTILAVDEAHQSMTFAGDVPVGWRAQLMKANFDRLVDGAFDAAELTASRAGSGEGPVLAVAISCVGRRLVLAERAEEEVEATLEVLGDQTRQVGFYSYGELSPFGVGNCDLHNQTMTLTTIAEG